MRFMSIDAGSNATKYRVWEIEAGEPTLIAERRFPMRIGEGVFTTGRIAAESIAGAVRVMQEVCNDRDMLGVTAWRAATTSAAREACNGQDLVNAIRSATGIELEILTGSEEARLIALGLLASRNDGLRRTIIDIGGGSTEIIFARGAETVHAVSTNIGAVRMSETYFAAIPPAAEAIERLEAHLRDVLEKTQLPAEIGTELLGSGGTIVALKMMIGDGNGEIELARLSALIEKLRAMNVKQICGAYPIEEQRAEIILAGALILRAVMNRVGHESVLMVRGGVGDGLLREFLR